MNLLKKFATRFSSSYVEQIPYLAEKLFNRDLIRIQGQDTLQFLQGLTTNDMKHLANEGNQCVYTLILNKGGRVMCDSIIYRTRNSDTFIIECDKQISYDLRRHLRLFRVRKQIDIDSIGNEYSTWVIFNENFMVQNHGINNDDIDDKDVIFCQDPRLKKIGSRLILEKSLDTELQNILKIKSDLTTNDNDYRLHRYRLGIGEGVEDHPPSKCFPFETNCDYLHGISFDKGCYLGQELTARVFHTGVIRKRLMPIQLKKKIDHEIVDVQLRSGTKIGTIRGVKNTIALALMRVDQAFKADEIIIDDEPAELIIPDWWPKELQKKKSSNLELKTNLEFEIPN